MRDVDNGQARRLHLDLPVTLVRRGMIRLIGGWLGLAALSCLLTLVALHAVLPRLQAPALEARRTLNEPRYRFVIEFLPQVVTAMELGM